MFGELLLVPAVPPHGLPPESQKHLLVPLNPLADGWGTKAGDLIILDLCQDKVVDEDPESCLMKIAIHWLKILDEWRFDAGVERPNADSAGNAGFRGPQIKPGMTRMRIPWAGTKDPLMKSAEPKHRVIPLNRNASP